MIKAIIFDLDSCLSAADEPGQQLYAPALEAITKANQGHLSPAVLQKAFADMWRLPFDFVAERYGFTPAMRTAGWEVLARLEVTPLPGVPALRRFGAATRNGLRMPKDCYTTRRRPGTLSGGRTLEVKSHSTTTIATPLWRPILDIVVG